jgi:hypothetical protein
VDDTPFSTTLPSPVDGAPLVPFVDSGPVVTPLAALAKEDIAVAVKGAMPSIAGGGAKSDATLAPFNAGGNGSPPAV